MNRTDLLVPAANTALSRTRTSGISSANTFVLNGSTGLIEVHAENQGVFLKFSPNGAVVACTNANFDAYIQAGQTRHYAVNPGTSISVIEAAATATFTLIEDTI